MRRLASAARIALAAGVLAAGSVTMAGCSSSGGCVDYAAPQPLATRIAETDLAAVVSFSDTGRTVQYTAIYPVHRARVVQVLRGRQPAGDLLVTVVPGACVTTGQPAEYEDGDPLATKGTRVLLLSGERSDGVYSLAPWDVVSKDEYDAALRAEPTASPSD